MSSGDVKGWIDDLMVGDSVSAPNDSHSSEDYLQPVVAYPSRQHPPEHHRPAQLRKADWREDPQAQARAEEEQEEDEDSVQPFDAADMSRDQSFDAVEKREELENAKR
eukprot:837794-Rhodomonas_salina.1